MPLRRLLIAATLLIGSGLYIKLVLLPSEEQAEIASFALGRIDQRGLSAVVVKNSHGEFRLENHRSSEMRAETTSDPALLGAADLAGWKLAAVPEAPLEPGKLGALLAAVARLQFGDPLPAAEVEADRSVYGLTPPQLTIQAQAGDRSAEIRFGKQNEYLRLRYVEIAGSPAVYLLPEALYTNADLKMNDLRKVLPISFVDSTVREIELSGAKPIVLSREGGEWRISRPDPLRAGAAAVSDLTRSLRGLRSTTFIDNATERLGDFGLERPLRTITLRFQNEQPPAQEIILGEAQGKQYFTLRGASTVYETSPFASELLETKVERFREREFLRLNTDSVVGVSVEGQHRQPIRLERVGTEWKIDGAAADPVFIDQYLGRLSALSAVGFPPISDRAGFDQPRLKVVIRLAEAVPSNERVLVVGAPVKYAGAEHYFAQVLDVGETFLIDQDSLKELEPNLEAISQGPEPEPLEFDSASSVTGQSKGKGQGAARRR